MKQTKNKNYRKKNKITKKKYQKGGDLDQSTQSIPADGTCMYRAIIYQLLVNIEKTHQKLQQYVYSGEQQNFKDIETLKKNISTKYDEKSTENELNIKHINNLKKAIYSDENFNEFWLISDIFQ